MTPKMPVAASASDDGGKQHQQRHVEARPRHGLRDELGQRTRGEQRQVGIDLAEQRADRRQLRHRIAGGANDDADRPRGPLRVRHEQLRDGRLTRVALQDVGDDADDLDARAVDVDEPADRVVVRQTSGAHRPD